MGMDPDEYNSPPMKYLTADNIMKNVKTIKSRARIARLQYFIEAIIRHLHDFVREQDWVRQNGNTQ